MPYHSPLLFQRVTSITTFSRRLSTAAAFILSHFTRAGFIFKAQMVGHRRRCYPANAAVRMVWKIAQALGEHRRVLVMKCERKALDPRGTSEYLLMCLVLYFAVEPFHLRR